MATVDIDRLVEEIVTLPTLPRNLDRITRILEDPDPSLSELGRAIATDPAFALKTLRLVNSAYYGLRQEVSSVELAVTLLGLKVMKNLVVTAIVCETLRDSETLLRHSVGTALAARAFAEQTKPRLRIDGETAFSFGLLHDIGKIIIVSFLPTEAKEILELRAAEGLRLYEAERRVLGTDHAELGARLATRWHLPQLLAATIAAHHNIDEAPDPQVRQMAGLITVASVTATLAGFPAEPAAVAALADSAWDASQLRKADLPPALDAFFDSLPSMDQFLAPAG